VNTQRAQSQRNTATWIAAAVALVAGWALFHFQGVTDIGYIANEARTSGFSWLFWRWRVDWAGSHYAINFLAPPLALWLLFRRRAELRAATLHVAWAGFFVFLLGLALHILGAKAQQTRLSLFAMVVILWGLPWFALGPGVGRALRYPLLAMIFIVPLNFFDYLLNPFRVMATRLSAAIGSGLGLPVQSLGSLLIESESHAWMIDLADSTSGIFALLSLTLWTLFLADLLYRHAARRMFLLIAATPILFFATTTLRGIILGFLAQGLSAQTANALNQRYPALLMLLLFLLLQLAWIRLLAIRPRSIASRFQNMIKPQGDAPPPPSTRDGLL